ncbi:DUF429 domain-containing protein [Sandaracinus amylolyticus]|uniref:DUF429 domain-containing protein n=1 Tax=Sandaracinus amylolyticus TaxID=927083 RepID=A0A0F6W8D8_9BACT|nr:DUF429 domain-containing protein [Sandaracinus amylolyticus]AKF10023.1 hypothetical protein DB32_007172 [Sandaracinus amylolyticus]
MLTLGIDLGAQANETYGCAIDWSGGACRVAALHPKLDDERLVKLVTDDAFAAIGVDVPFGWPVAFVELLTARGSAQSWSVDAARLRLRDTDRHCKRLTGKDPLSVSSDRIAAPAMRWRLLATRVASASARLHEVYPGSALAVWSLEHKAYKNADQRDARIRILSALRAKLSLCVVDADAECLATCADALDALVASLIARAVALGRVHPIPPDLEAAAACEGWIQIPTCNVAELRC